MSDFNFKAGDKVYCPKVSNKVLTLENTECSKYSVKISLESGMIRSFMIDGNHFHLDLNPSIFPATQEWYDKLVHAYPNLEKPHTKKKPREIIQALLDDGWNIVPVIYRESEHEYFGYANRTYTTMTAIPIDPKSGKVIVDYVNGEVVLEG